MEYKRTKNDQIQAAFALRVGKLLKQYHEVEGEYYENNDFYDATLTICLLQNLLTYCNQSINKLSVQTALSKYFESELDDDDYETIGGLVMRMFGRMPRRGEAISSDGFSFRVVQADRRRIHRLEVTREQVATSEE